MANAMVALANITLGSAASTVTFTSIPATYRDLRLVVTTKNVTSQGYLGLQFNGDTGSTAYYYVQMNGNGTNSYSSVLGPSDGVTAIYVYPIGTTDATNGQIDVMDYAVTDKHKSVLSRTNDSSANAVALAGRWANTAAITSLRFWTGSGSWGSGSTFSLYGIVSA